MFLYETHMHTSEGSECASASGAEQAEHFKKAGYDGIIVTDHFFNGNSHINFAYPNESWERKIDLFCLGYENAKKRGDEIGLKVFFGFEFNFHSAEWLVYGLSPEFLKAHPEIMEMCPEDFLTLFRDNGATVIQAHPFRDAPYVTGMRVFPKYVDGMEIYNAKNSERSNKVAEVFAEEFGLRECCGSDCHHAWDNELCAMGSEKELFSIGDICEAFKSGRLELIRHV